MDVLIITTAYLLDLLLGDPSWFPHPVRLIGWSVGQLEVCLRKAVWTPRGEQAAGIILVLTVVGAVYGTSHELLVLSASLSRTLFVLLSILVAWTTLATKSLAQAAGDVRRPLADGDLPGARKKLSMIVGRDTQELPESEIVRATVETVAENTSDGVIAPLFYLAIGGPALALAYKAVNTLDSMVGHRNERYRHFGWAAARLDDLANFIPARITAVLICMATEIVALMRFSVPEPQSEIRNPKSGSWRIMLRDGTKHPSPNSGWPEAAMAGSLGVRLGGTSTYGGKLSQRPHLGDPTRMLESNDIALAVRLLYAASLLGVLAAATTRFCGS